MAVDANAYLYSDFASNGADNVVPTLWAEEIYTRARKVALMTPLMGLGVVSQDSRLLGRAGKSFLAPKMTLLSASNLTEGTATPVSALDFDGVTVTVQERGLAVQWSILGESYSLDAFRSAVVENLSGALAEKLNADLVTELTSTSTAAVYPISSGTTRYATGTIVAGAGLTVEQLNEADRVVKTALNSGVSAYVIHPFQEKQLRDLDQFLDASKYGDAELMRTGEIGRIFGKPIFVSAHVQSATENTSVTVYRALALAPKACIYAPKITAALEFDRGDILDRAWTVQLTATYGFQNFEEAAIVPIKSA